MAADQQPEIKRRHHYLPCSYLSGFATEDERDGLIWVLDGKEHKRYQQKCENVGYLKDYYLVDLPDTKPDAIEDAFSEVEGIGKQIILKVEKDRAVPSGKDFYDFMGYLGLLFARVPNVREYWNTQMGNVMKMAARMHLGTLTPEEIYQFFIAKSQPLESVSQAERLKNYVMGDDYTVQYDQTYEIKTVLESAEATASLLTERSWFVAFRTENQANRFVTCDHPVMLDWTDKPEGVFPPGFGLMETRVYVPVTMNVAVVGMFEKTEYKSIRLTNRLIKIHNSLAVRHSDRFLFSFDSEIKLLNGLGEEYVLPLS